MGARRDRKTQLRAFARERFRATVFRARYAGSPLFGVAVAHQDRALKPRLEAELPRSLTGLAAANAYPRSQERLPCRPSVFGLRCRE